MSDHLASLNLQQRRAAEYGIKPGKAKDVGPLLVIAGAGSGKTKTIALRAAHLLVNGSHPHRILLLTFTRRAAKEMTQRVRRRGIQCFKDAKAGLAVVWHVSRRRRSAFARIRSAIGLKPSFTILDRSDAADLMNVVRHDLDQSKKESRFPQKDTCLSIYSLAVNSGAPLETYFGNPVSMVRRLGG